MPCAEPMWKYDTPLCCSGMGLRLPRADVQWSSSAAGAPPSPEHPSSAASLQFSSCIREDKLMLSSLGNLPSFSSSGLQLLNDYALGHAGEKQPCAPPEQAASRMSSERTRVAFESPQCLLLPTRGFSGSESQNSLFRFYLKYTLFDFS